MKREANRKREEVLVTTSLRVQPELLERFSAQARKNYRSTAAEIRRLMTEYVEEAETADEVAA